jgi:hypothetical protein
MVRESIWPIGRPLRIAEGRRGKKCARFSGGEGDREAIVRDKETAEKVWVRRRSPKKTRLDGEATPDNTQGPSGSHRGDRFFSTRHR